jgi:endo-1,4-beta-D-glucanase Y
MRFFEMNKKLLFSALAVGTAMMLSACGDEGGTSPEPVVTPTNSAAVPTSSAAVTPGPTPQGAYGILPKTANPSIITDNWYQVWKATYYKTYQEEAALYPVLAMDWPSVFGNYIAAGLYPARIVWDTSSDSYCVIDECTNSYKKRGCTVSEGVGYGMLITLFAGDWAAFNSLWIYNRGYREYQGAGNLMPWRTGTYSFESLASAANSSSATDADLDIATSLVLAYYASGNQGYLDDALLVINSIWTEEISPSLLIYSGNTPTWKKATSAYNLSYFSPVALKLFALVDKNHDWTGVLNTMYTYMQNVQAAGTGVFPDWTDANGTAIDPNNGSAAKTYWTFNKEAVRIPWRIAWDYYWTQDPRAAQVLNTLNSFISTRSNGDPANLETSGKVMYSAVAGKEDVSSTSLMAHWHGAWCLTGMAGNQNWLDACTSAFNAREISGFSYFPHILMTMYGELLNGLFVKPANLPL